MVLNTRSTCSGVRYAKATVADVPGLIIVPDNWDVNTYALNDTNTTGAAFTTNVITSAQWTTLENAGCAFLPAAGFRNGTSLHVYSYGNGYYWSSSCSSSQYACDLIISGGNVNPSNYNDYRNDGFSVRLVQDAN